MPRVVKAESEKARGIPSHRNRPANPIGAPRPIGTEYEIPLEPLTAERVRELWSRTYNRQGKPDWSHIFPYYHEEIVFQDSIQRVEGIEAFVAMCNRLSRRCERLDMDILSVVADGTVIYMQWKMQMIFRRFPSSPVHGCSRLTLGEDGRIIAQRDYFDLWGDIFDGIPGFRRVYRWFMQKYFG